MLFRSTLDSLRQMPVPLRDLTAAELAPWIALHEQLVHTGPRHLHEEDTPDTARHPDDGQPELLDALNQLVATTLGLDERDQALIHDLVHVRLALADGKLGREAVRTSAVSELHGYARTLRRELDDFVGESTERRHAVTVLRDEHSAMVVVDFTKDREAAREVRVLAAGAADARALEKARQRLRVEHAQWVYFDRALRIYEGRKTYLFKPRQRFHWTRTQAMIDAGEIIADTLNSAPG